MDFIVYCIGICINNMIFYRYGLKWIQSVYRYRCFRSIQFPSDRMRPQRWKTTMANSDILWLRFWRWFAIINWRVASRLTFWFAFFSAILLYAIAKSVLWIYTQLGVYCSPVWLVWFIEISTSAFASALNNRSMVKLLVIVWLLSFLWRRS